MGFQFWQKLKQIIWFDRSAFVSGLIRIYQLVYVVYKIDEHIVLKTSRVYEPLTSDASPRDHWFYASETLFHFNLMKDKRTVFRLLEQRPHDGKTSKFQPAAKTTSWTVLQTGLEFLFLPGHCLFLAQ